MNRPRGGTTHFEIQCSAGSDILSFEQDCLDICYCASNPCSVHGQCFDCRRTGREEVQKRMSCTQHSVIVGDREFEATSDYSCRCHENYQTALGPGGLLTYHDDDSTGHHECDEEGTWVNLTKHDPAWKFSCPCHSGPELVIDGGPKGCGTYSRVSGGTISIDHLDKHTSVELFSDDLIFVNCDEGFSIHHKPQSTKFEVKCPDTGPSGWRPGLFQGHL